VILAYNLISKIFIKCLTMKTKQASAMGIAKKAMPIALVYTIQ